MTESRSPSATTDTRGDLLALLGAVSLGGCWCRPSDQGPCGHCKTKCEGGSAIDGFHCFLLPNCSETQANTNGMWVVAAKSHRALPILPILVCVGPAPTRSWSRETSGVAHSSAKSAARLDDTACRQKPPQKPRRRALSHAPSSAGPARPPRECLRDRAREQYHGHWRSEHDLRVASQVR
jgi:hypothetical protein